MRRGTTMTPVQRARVKAGLLKRSGPVDDRFWSKVDRQGPNECWPWLGSFFRDGYGQFWQDGTNRRAPRVAYELASASAIPSEVVVRHTCDNARCVNPFHLVLGTQLDNIRDSIARGRHSGAKLTARLAAEARRRVADGESQRAVADDFGVTPSNVSRIVAGKVWAEPS